MAFPEEAAPLTADPRRHSRRSDPRTRQACPSLPAGRQTDRHPDRRGMVPGARTRISEADAVRAGHRQRPAALVGPGPAVAVRGLPLFRRFRAHHPRPDLRGRHHHRRRAGGRHPRPLRSRHGQARVRRIGERRQDRLSPSWARPSPPRNSSANPRTSPGSATSWPTRRTAPPTATPTTRSARWPFKAAPKSTTSTSISTPSGTTIRTAAPPSTPYATSSFR